MSRPEVGDRVLYGVPPGRVCEYTVTRLHPISMVEITRFDPRLDRDIVIDVYPDELSEATA